MQKRILNKISLLLASVLIAATTLTLAGCAKNEVPAVNENVMVSVAGGEFGVGNTKFNFNVTDAEGNTTEFVVNTDETTVGDALLKVNLIAGEDSEYGLYVKTVNGVTADYDVDQTYWAFYINGEYAMTGVSDTNVEAGATYEFKVEK